MSSGPPGFAPPEPSRPAAPPTPAAATPGTYAPGTHQPSWADPSPFVNDYTRPLPSYAETFSGPGYHTAPPRTSGFAVAALVCALAGVVLAVPAVAAVVLGHVGVVATRNNIRRGHGLAVAALVIGYVTVAFWALIFVVFNLVG